MGSPMYQNIIGDKRASLYPAQRSRNGFCSTTGRRETRNSEQSSSIGRPSSRKGSYFNADPLRVRVDVGLGRPHPQILHAPECGDPLENGMRQRFLEIVTARGRDLFNFHPEEIIVPGPDGIIVLANGDIVKPDLDCD